MQAFFFGSCTGGAGNSLPVDEITADGKQERDAVRFRNMKFSGFIGGNGSALVQSFQPHLIPDSRTVFTVSPDDSVAAVEDGALSIEVNGIIGT